MRVRLVSARRMLKWATVAWVVVAALVSSHSSAGSATDEPTLWRTIPVAGNPENVIVNPDTELLYTTHVTQDLNIFNAETGQVLATLHELGTGMALNRTTNTLYVAGWFYSTVSVVDLDTNTVVTKIPVAEQPLAIAVNPVTNRIYVNGNQPTVSVIDGGTNTVIEEIDHYASDLAVDPANNRLYVLTYEADTSSRLLAIDGDTSEVLSEVVVGREARAVAVDSAAGKVYVVSSVDGGTGTGQLFIIDAGSLSVEKRLTTDQQASSVAVNPLTHYAYVGQFYGDSVAVFNSSGQRIATVSVGSGSSPNDVAVDELHNLAYTADANAGKVSVIGNGPAPATTPPTATPSGFVAGGGRPPGSEGPPNAEIVFGVLFMLLGGSLLFWPHRSGDPLSSR